jgi:hypothetical protein
MSTPIQGANTRELQYGHCTLYNVHVYAVKRGPRHLDIAEPEPEQFLLEYIERNNWGLVAP